MPNVEVAEQAGDRLTPPDPAANLSEDVVLVLPNAVAVLDGATSLHPGTRSGGWYAARLAEALEPRLAEPGRDLADVLANAIAELVATFGLRPGAAPSSTVSLLRWDDEHVDALVLADSPIVLDTTDGMRPVLDDQLASLQSRPGAGYRDRLRSGEGFGAGHRDALGTSMDRTSRWRNVDGGFWVAEAVPEAAAHASRLRLARRDVTSAMVMTDGVSCGVQEYGIYPDWTAMLDVALRDGPDAVLDQVRAAERSDPDGVRWPRSKRHDDQALALVRSADT